MNQHSMNNFLWLNYGNNNNIKGNLRPVLGSHRSLQGHHKSLNKLTAALFLSPNPWDHPVVGKNDNNNYLWSFYFHSDKIYNDSQFTGTVFSIIFNYKESALQVQMSVCLCVTKLKFCLLTAFNIIVYSSRIVWRFQNVPKCS